MRDIAFSPNKRWLFSVSKDNTIRAWYNDIPKVLSTAEDYLYQIVVKENYLFYVDGHGALGRIDFNGSIDTAEKITISSSNKEN